MKSLIDAEAARREKLHENHASSRPLSKGYEGVGMMGEFAFGKLVGMMPDLEDRPGGDKGVDFVVPLRFTVDVKTARKPRNLISEVGKPTADILVLAGYDDDSGEVSMMGWEFGSVVRAAPSKDFGYGVINHYIPAKNLRPMSDLVARVMRLS